MLWNQLGLQFQSFGFLQQIGRYQFWKFLWYSILITTQKGESAPVDLPFLSPQSRIFRANNLTANLNMRDGADIHIVSAKL